MASGELILGDRDIHVFAMPLDIGPDALEVCAEFLSPSERERAARFKFDPHRNRFIAGRGWMRWILGRYLGVAPGRIEFEYSSRGKPSLRRDVTTDNLHFNLSHSADLAALAVTRLGEIGVDVECIRSVNRVDDLVARFFSARETELFLRLAETEKPAAFFNLWTRKEAWLKATGEGITGPLSEVEVSFLAGDPARLMALHGDAEKAREWILLEFAPREDFVGAVAVRANGIRIQFWKPPPLPQMS